MRVDRKMVISHIRSKEKQKKREDREGEKGGWSKEKEEKWNFHEAIPMPPNLNEICKWCCRWWFTICFQPVLSFYNLHQPVLDLPKT